MNDYKLDPPCSDNRLLIHLRHFYVCDLLFKLHCYAGYMSKVPEVFFSDKQWYFTPLLEGGIKTPQLKDNTPHPTPTFLFLMFFNVLKCKFELRACLHPPNIFLYPPPIQIPINSPGRNTRYLRPAQSLEGCTLARALPAQSLGSRSIAWCGMSFSLQHSIYIGNVVFVYL